MTRLTEAGPLRLAFVVTGLGVGGAEAMLVKLLSRLDRARFEPMVVSLAKRGPLAAQIEALDVPLVALDASAATAVCAAWRGCRALRAFRPDVLQGWMYHGNVAALGAVLAVPGRPRVLWSIRQSLDTLDNEKTTTAAVIRIGAAMTGRVERILYNSLASAEQHEALGYPRRLRCLVDNGFDCTRFAPDPARRAAVRQELGIAPEAPLIGMIARFHPMKDHDSFLQAACALHDRRPDARFVLAGRGVDEHNPAFRDAAATLGPALRLLGEVSDTARLFAALDLAVSASAWGEGFPNVIGEAMASALPVVATDIGDSRRVLGGCGRIVPPRDPAVLAQACLDLLAMPEAQRVALGEAARRRVESEFSLDAVTRHHEALWRAPPEGRA